MEKAKAFFSSIEYRNYMKCKKRIKEFPSEKNLSIYLYWAGKCLDLALTKYDDLGWVNKGGFYAWDCNVEAKV